MNKVFALAVSLSLLFTLTAPSPVEAFGVFGPRKSDFSRTVSVEEARRVLVTVEYRKRKGAPESRACKLRVTVARAGWETGSRRFTSWTKWRDKMFFWTLTYGGASNGTASLRVSVSTNGQCWYSVLVG